MPWMVARVWYIEDANNAEEAITAAGDGQHTDVWVHRVQIPAAIDDGQDDDFYDGSGNREADVEEELLRIARLREGSQ